MCLFGPVTMKENGVATTGSIEIWGRPSPNLVATKSKIDNWTKLGEILWTFVTLVAPYIWEIPHIMSPRWKQNSPSQLAGKLGCRYVTWTPPTTYTCTRLEFRTEQSLGVGARQFFSSEDGGTFWVDNAGFRNSWVVTSHASHPCYRGQWPQISIGAVW